MLSTEFLLTSLIVALIPGTGVLFTISAGLFLGWRASFLAALGGTIGIVPHLCASILGLAAILHTSALAFQTLKILGVIYLLYLAWATWRSTGGLQIETPPGQGLWRIALKAFLVNILNPKLSLFFLAFMPQFISPSSESPMTQLLLLSGIFMAITFVVFIAYGLLATSARTHIIDSPRSQRWLQRSFAASFLALGAHLANSER